jgi:hypothetical protein
MSEPRTCLFLLLQTSPQRAAKYAAMLALLAVDPLPANQSTAFRAFREYVAFRRWVGRLCPRCSQQPLFPLSGGFVSMGSQFLRSSG